MAGSDRSSVRTDLVRLGLGDLTAAMDTLDELAELLSLDRATITEDLGRAADPDGALRALVRIARRGSADVGRAMADPLDRPALWALLGASEGYGDFYFRHPEEIANLAGARGGLPSLDLMRAELLAAVGDENGFAGTGEEAGWVALRVAYRRIVARIAVYDLLAGDAEAVLAPVAAALADAAAAALEASLSVARTRVSKGRPGGIFPREQVAATKLAIIGMGKTGARELNYVSDVDVIFVCGAEPGALEEIGESRVIDIATRLATQTMHGISGVEIEPPLWEVDANLRPEGKQGALVRTLDSHLSYYSRWAKSWEFQALLKARPLAGDLDLGEEYVAAVQPKIWTSAARENFVDSVQRMRERVTDNIPPPSSPATTACCACWSTGCSCAGCVVRTSCPIDPTTDACSPGRAVSPAAVRRSGNSGRA
ncbi:MAG: bifunctional glutamine-synthetase adenylyltransferase/deadenyltransferase [Microbacterium sp.]|nr:bifunctional glutamine-synthetase adenylyltransferase/deadenyltransferase [Microbacterium sp.]